ncbi:MAG: TRAP transporter substrate-binding protein DctP [Desulfatibacillaceae bacterium]|nr:TRAP transporter substrate-binding protein DctP [Desulfatibacillaceae bacterium]
MHFRPAWFCTLILCLSLFFVPLAGASEKFFWKTATLAPDGIGWSKHMKEIIFPEMEKSTKGNLQIKVYWGGVMGDEEDYITKIRIGQLQGAGLSAQGTFVACPPMTALGLPFLFNDYNEVDYVKAYMQESFDLRMSDRGFFMVGWIDQDFDQIYSSKYPMATLDDFKKTRFIVWYGPMEAALFKAFGASAYPVNVPELATAVRQGVADGAIGPAVWVVGAQLYSKLAFVNPMRIRYSPASIILTMDAWTSLPDEYRQDFYQQRLELGWRYTNLVRQDNEKFLNAMLQYGVKKTEMKQQDYEAIKAKAMEVWPVVTGDLFPKAVLDEITGHLEDFRAGKRLTLEHLLRLSKIPDSDAANPEFIERIKQMVKESMAAYGHDPAGLLDAGSISN